jgi:autotransporter-associated beta strand protein
MATSWKAIAINIDYEDPINWTNQVPDFTSAAFFGGSTITNILDNSGTELDVGEWVFSAGAPNYNFTIRSDGAFITTLTFVGGGIMLNGSSVIITISPTAQLFFINTSSAGNAVIDDNSLIELNDFSTLGSASINIGFEPDNKNPKIEFAQQSSAGNATITNHNELFFFDHSSAGSAMITSYTNTSHSYAMEFHDYSSAGNAIIVNYALLNFFENSNAGSATINTLAGGKTLFEDNSDGDNAQLNTDSASTVDFSNTSGPADDNRVTVGSIAGAGTYLLGADQLTVGGNGLSRTVSGPVEDGGSNGGTGASLVKVGPGTLTLSHARNTYSGGTTLEQGVLDLAAVRAAGSGPIIFAGKAKVVKVVIEKTALSGHVFGNPIDSFAVHDALDLAGFKFHADATAKYHPATHLLTVHSGHFTDKFTLFSPQGKHFTLANDRHGGTLVTLTSPPVAATIASNSSHDTGGEHAAVDLAISASHLGDFLLVG